MKFAHLSWIIAYAIALSVGCASIHPNEAIEPNIGLHFDSVDVCKLETKRSPGEKRITLPMTLEAERFKDRENPLFKSLLFKKLMKIIADLSNQYTIDDTVVHRRKENIGFENYERVKLYRSEVKAFLEYLWPYYLPNSVYRNELEMEEFENGREEVRSVLSYSRSAESGYNSAYITAIIIESFMQDLLRTPKILAPTFEQEDSRKGIVRKLSEINRTFDEYDESDYYLNRIKRGVFGIVDPNLLDVLEDVYTGERIDLRTDLRVYVEGFDREMTPLNRGISITEVNKKNRFTSGILASIDPTECGVTEREIIALNIFLNLIEQRVRVVAKTGIGSGSQRVGAKDASLEEVAVTVILYKIAERIGYEFFWNYSYSETLDDKGNLLALDRRLDGEADQETIEISKGIDELLKQIYLPWSAVNASRAPN